MRLGWTSRHGLVIALVLAPAAAFPAGARKAAKAGPVKSQHADRPDVALGYSYTHSGEANLNGWQLDGTFPVTRSWRLVFDLNGHYGSFAGADLSQLGFFAGPRRVFHGERLVPFAEALLGLEHRSTSAGGVEDSHTDWGFAFGGGADYRLGGPWKVRLEADLMLLHAEGGWDTDPRLSLLAVYSFGRR